MSKAGQQDGGPAARLETATGGEGELRLALGGRLSAETVGDIWREAGDAVEAAVEGGHVVIDTAEVSYCDGSGIGLLVDLMRRQRARGGTLDFEGLSDDLKRLIQIYDPASILKAEHPKPAPTRLPVEVGKWAVHLWHDLRLQITFLGEVAAGLVRAVLEPRKVRWRDMFLIAEKAGVNAAPIAVLIGFIIGLVIAFQSVIPLQQFGVEIFVADLTGIGMIRELGPLMTAIVLVSRSGSAFAAELGTMKVNEELDALSTMGLNPVRFLVVPRVIGITIMCPFVTLLTMLAGILGGMIVITSLGYPVVTYFDHVFSIVTLTDLASGLFKATVLGLLVGTVGCLRGLQTGSGASAVGDAATSAVVSGIVLIVAVDGIFAVLFYYLGI